MSILDNSPCDQDLLQSYRFIFSIPRLTTLQFFTQSVNIPGISTPAKLQMTPQLDLKIPGDKIIFETLDVEFLLDEKLEAWNSISEWMRGIAFPENSEQYVNLKNLSKYSRTVEFPQYADGELVVLSASGQPTIKIHFFDMFPIRLSGVPFDVRISSEKTLTSMVSFEYKRYDVIKI